MSYEIRGLREDELEEHAELIHKSYEEFITQGRGFLAAPDWWLNNIRRDPFYRPEQTRVLLVDGHMVASVSNYERPMYCAGRVAKVGAIGSVATHPDHRRKGYAREVLAESLRWMRSTGFDFSFLFGNYQVYGRSGWSLFTALEIAAQVRAPHDACGLRVRPAQFPQDISVLQSLYDQFNVTMTGPFARPWEYWEKRVTGGYFHDRSVEFRVVEDRGTPVGYFRGATPGQVPELAWKRGETQLPTRVVGAILAQWPELEEVHFGLYTPELLAALKPHVWAPSFDAWGVRQSSIRLMERYKGLWTYIGPGGGVFPAVRDTNSLLRFLRENDYVFWSGVDSF